MVTNLNIQVPGDATEPIERQLRVLLEYLAFLENEQQVRYTYRYFVRNGIVVMRIQTALKISKRS